MVKSLVNNIKHDKWLLPLIIVFCISMLGAFYYGSASMSGIGFIYLSVTILGIALTRRWNLKKFLILTAVSFVAFLLFILLYNLTRGLFTRWFGADFWENTYFQDEPVFFTLAVFICPIAILIGAFGSIVMAIQKLIQKRKMRDSAITVKSVSQS